MNLTGDRRKQTGARCHVRRMAGLGSLMDSRHWNFDGQTAEPPNATSHSDIPAQVTRFFRLAGRP